MRTLVVYFSRTGHTQTLAQQIASACAADIEGLREPKSPPGALRYLRAVWQAALHLEAPIAPSQLNPADYDLVMLGTPVWMYNMASPMRSYIGQHRGQFRKLALFCTCDGAGQAKVLGDMQALCDKLPVATLGLSARELHDRFHQERLDRFLEQIKQVERMEAPAPLRPRPAF